MNTPLCLPPDMGLTEVTHSGLCAAFNLVFEQGQERRSELELIHFLNKKQLKIIYFVSDI